MHGHSQMGFCEPKNIYLTTNKKMFFFFFLKEDINGYIIRYLCINTYSIVLICFNRSYNETIYIYIHIYIYIII